MKKENNEVIIIGGDHHNTLAIIRCLGINKVPFKVIIHGNEETKKNIAVLYSKYIKQFYIVKNDVNSIYKELLNNKSINTQYIITCSDLAQYTIDKYYKELSKYYFIPGFKNKPGLVCNLMNKFEQKRWAEENNILMAKSWLITKNNEVFHIPTDLKYPCIVKPNISAFGKKDDIRIFNNNEELINELGNYNKSEYKELIIQEFLKKEFEICAIGCIGVNKKNYGRIIKKIRENPPKGGGSLTFAQFIIDAEIQKQVNIVIDKLIREGYNGQYDIEFFKCENGIYLNEINFRHSGNGYALIKSKIPAPYIWYLTAKGVETKIKFKQKIRKTFYFIDDFNELASLKKKYINFFTFIKDFICANAHSILSISDLKVFLIKIKQIIINKIKTK